MKVANITAIAMNHGFAGSFPSAEEVVEADATAMRDTADLIRVEYLQPDRLRNLDSR
jgi:hypothetical protein